jgi:CheY-like chemotaxis protein
LAFSRQQTLDVEAVDLGDLLHGLEDMLARSLGEDISLEIAAEAELWPCEADAGQLEQAVINLANNARDAMPEGGTLRFEAANLALLDSGAAREVDLPPGEYVVLTATDAGSGILPTLIDKIFDPFFTTKDIGKGSGLGLSMVYGFVEQLGGRITARSKAGEGATFSLYLPRFDRGETVESTPATDPPSAATGETVLVVEDDIDLQTTTRMLLVDLGYKVIVASSGPEALLHLAAEPIDLLLTDVVLPDGMNGPEVARKAHQRLPSLKVVYMSGYTGDVLRRHDDLDDGTVLIRKPFEVEELSRLLRQVLDGHRLQRA